MIENLKRFIYGVIPYYYTYFKDQKSDKLKYIKSLKDNPYISPYKNYPAYDFVQEYFDREYDINYESKNGMNYVMHNGKKLFFPQSFSTEKVCNYYTSLLIEQDIRYPHCYVKSIDEFKGKTLFDIGSAEGMTSLDAIDVLEFVYLFEYEDSWIKALQATFEPWNHKVQIVKKYVTDRITETHETLDNFVKNKVIDNAFLKMDIEGEECKALNGAIKFFESAKNLDFAICTYHKRNDCKDISSFLDKYNCVYKASGYMYYRHHLRNAILRGYKK